MSSRRQSDISQRDDELKVILHHSILSTSTPRDRPYRYQTALKAPLATLLLVTGLWPTRKALRVSLIAIAVLVHGYISLGNIFAWQVCGKIPLTEADRLSPWLCYGNLTYHESKKSWAGLLEPVVFSRYLFCFSQFSGYVFMAYSASLLQGRVDAMSIDTAASLLTRSQWISLNIQIVVYFAVWLTFQLFDAILIPGKYMPSGSYQVNWLIIENALMWLYIGTPCWLFAMITFALESFAVNTHHHIRDLQSGTLNDVIVIHQQFSERVFGTVRALKYWFIVHWISFGFTFVTDTAIGLKVAQFRDKTEFVFWVFSLMYLLMVMIPFCYPCIRAAALTDTCDLILEKLCYFLEADWPMQHPLRCRFNMNGFLEYAHHVGCGFWVGRLRFTLGLKWLSLFISLCGLASKLI